MNNGAKIIGNIAMDPAHIGGAVFIHSEGNFTMNGGTISGNSSYYGGGVDIGYSATFTMNNGEITGNSGYYGGGVCVRPYATFTMNNGNINSNKATLGGGIYVSGTLNLSGGMNSKNEAVKGGGVYVFKGLFNKTGGTITGYSTDPIDGNIANEGENDNGHAVYATGKDEANNIDVVKIKDKTSQTNNNLYFKGLDGDVTAPIWSGVWEY
jgi:hypothetical protein